MLRRQAADPISQHIARKVKVLCDAMIRWDDAQWTEAYVRSRRTKLEIALRNFAEKQKGELEASGQVSGVFLAEWVRNVHFLREVVRGAAHDHLALYSPRGSVLC
jgi:hypothetical protein